MIQKSLLNKNLYRPIILYNSKHKQPPAPILEVQKAEVDQERPFTG
jgi:hypothetical protein